MDKLTGFGPKPTHKWCSICCRRKPAAEYNEDASSWNQLQPKCRRCTKRLNDNYYLANAEKIRARRKERYQLQKLQKELNNGTIPTGPVGDPDGTGSD